MPRQNTFAAIDIGSNAVRLLIKRTDKQDSNGDIKALKKILLVRVPLRLGFDVFSNGKISKEKACKLTRLIKSFHHLMAVYDVDQYRACATSAIRDAKNGKCIIETVSSHTGINIDIITGQEEARVIYGNHIECLEDRNGNYMYVDVGGGSTEVNLITDGMLIFSASYNIGTIRLLSGTVSTGAWRQMTDEISLAVKSLGHVNIIGTGGNINKLYRLSDKKDKQSKNLPTYSLRQLYASLRSLSTEGRARMYDLKEDRADVIVPAAEIFLRIADTLHTDYIHVPGIGLADGIISELYSDKTSNNNALTP